MYRVTIEEYIDGEGWKTRTKTTDKKLWTQYINLSGLSELLGLTRAQLRYRVHKL
jgi:hypothetical protein